MNKLPQHTSQSLLKSSFIPLDCDIECRRNQVKRLINVAKPAVIDGVLLILTELHREQLVRQLYQSEAQKCPPCPKQTTI
jgi:hypothetical protein